MCGALSHAPASTAVTALRKEPDERMMSFSASTTRKNTRPPAKQPRPDPKRDGLVVEQRLQRRRVGEQQLQDHDRADAERQVLVAQMRLERQRRVEQVAAVQQIEDLADRDAR